RLHLICVDFCADEEVGLWLTTVCPMTGQVSITFFPLFPMIFRFPTDHDHNRFLALSRFLLHNRQVDKALLLFNRAFLAEFFHNLISVSLCYYHFSQHDEHKDQLHMALAYYALLNDNEIHY